MATEYTGRPPLFRQIGAGSTSFGPADMVQILVVTSTQTLSSHWGRSRRFRQSPVSIPQWFVRFLGAFCLFWAFSAGLVAASEVSRERLIYVVARDEQGRFLPDLQASDFELLEDGVRKPILRLQSASTDSDPSLRRLFVFCFDDGLAVRELFQVRRWLVSAIDTLSIGDAVAVYRSGILSGFRADRESIARLIRFFGGRGFEARLGSLHSAVPRTPEQFGPESPTPEGRQQELEDLFRHGMAGEFFPVLSALRDVPGRKVLLYFGSQLPRSIQKLPLGTDALVRMVADAGVSVFVVSSTPPISVFMKQLAGRTGGRVEMLPVDGRLQLRDLMAETSSYYRLTFETGVPLDGLFRRITVSSAAAGTVTSQEGYFATPAGAGSVFGRTLRGALGRPHHYGDFPITVTAETVVEPPASPGLEVAVTFPLRGVVMQPSVSDSRPVQIFHLFVLAYAAQGEMLGAWSSRFVVRAPSDRSASQALLQQRLPADPQTVSSLRVVLVGGVNQHIGQAEVRLSDSR